MNATKRVGLASLAIGTAMVAIMMFPSATSQATAVAFGSLVSSGDSDFVPTLTDGGDYVICRIDFGDANVITDDTFYLSSGDANGDDDDVEKFDTRLNTYTAGSKNAGTIVLDADNTELTSTSPCATAAETEVNWIDKDSDGKFTDLDWLYIGRDTDGGTDIDGATNAGDYWIRLSTTTGGNAGTLVKTGDTDLRDFGGGTNFGDATVAEFGFFDADNSGGFNQGDWAYLDRNAVAAAGDVPGLYMRRLVHGTDAFGSVVMSNSGDFVPTLTDGGDYVICRIDFGDANVITDDTFYLSSGDANGDDDDVEKFDIRLTKYISGSKEPGTLVVDADNTELTSTSPCATAAETEVNWIDKDSDGKFTDLDWLYIGRDTDGGTDIDGATNAGDYWIRLSTTTGGNAGTLVKTGDTDLRDFGGGTNFGDATVAEFGFFDADNSGGFNQGDWAYLDRNAVAAAGDIPGLYMRRLVHASEVFGSVVVSNSSDFVPTLTDGGDYVICRIDFGDAGVITDDTFYISSGDANGDDDDVEKFDIRLTKYISGSKEPGTLVVDADNTELTSTSPCATAAETEVNWIDKDSDGKLTQMDWIFIGRDTDGGTDIDGATNAGDYWIRLTMTTGGAAGTLVKTGDTDLRDFGGGTNLGDATVAEFGFFDADNSGGFNQGDWAYLDRNAVAAAGDIPGLYMTRLVTGTVTSGGTTTTTTTTTSPGGNITTPPVITTTTTSPAITTTTTSPAATTTTTAAGGGGTTTPKTPGFELVALVAAAGVAAAVLVYRRK